MPVISTIAAATARAFGAFKSLGGAADEFFDYVTLLLHGDGTNGAQNNTFLDSSTNNFTITRNGNTTQGTFSPFSQTGWSNYFNNGGFSLTDSANLRFGTGDYTVEAWVWFTQSTDPQCIFSNVLNSNFNLDVYAGSFRHQHGTTTVNTYSASGYLNQWVHIAATRSGSTCKLFLNGTEVASATSSSDLQGNYPATGIGRFSSSYVNPILGGYLSNLRVIKGQALYSGAFTPSTSPLTNSSVGSTGTGAASSITGTVALLTHQSNRFIDNSGNSVALTNQGTTGPSVQAFSPFAPTAAYSAATVGGSGYFDGSGDYLTAASNAAFGYGTGDFTIECWFYLNTLPGGAAGAYLIDQRTTSPQVTPAVYVYSDGSIQYFVNGSTVITGGSVVINQWNHWALSRASGTTKMFLNGTQIGSSYSDSNSYITAPVAIGARFNGQDFVTGYISNFRIVKGTAVYTSAFTPPTTPLTAIANTSLLLNFTNGGIIDNTAKNVLETVGNAQISTSVKKYGTGSLAFDGTGDYLDVPSTVNLSFGTGDFTIEFWIKTSSTGFNIMNPSSATGSGYWGLLVQSSDLRWNSAYNVTNLFAVSATSILDNNWHHVAIARSSGTTKVFYDGVSQTSQADSTNYSGVAAWRIGSGNVAALNGYIDDLRITKGIARYTANFTPPTAAFADQ